MSVHRGGKTSICPLGNSD